MERLTLADGPTVSVQLKATDFAELARQRVTLVINNRPDGKTPAQLGAAEGRHAAKRAGFANLSIPVELAPFRAEDVDRLDRHPA